MSKARLPPAPILAPRGSFTPVRLTQPSNAQVRSEKLALEAAFLAEEKRRQEENPVPPPLSKDFKKNDSPLFSSPPSFRREPVVPRQTSSWTARAPSTYGRLFLQPIPRVALEGFRNTGNTCYMNSILAALLHLPAFVRVLQNPTIWGMLRAPPSAAQKPSSMCTGVVDLTEDGDVEPSASSAPVPPSVSLAAVFESLRRLAEMRMDSHEVIDPADVKKVCPTAILHALSCLRPFIAACL